MEAVLVWIALAVLCLASAAPGVRAAEPGPEGSAESLHERAAAKFEKTVQAKDAPGAVAAQAGQASGAALPGKGSDPAKAEKASERAAPPAPAREEEEKDSLWRQMKDIYGVFFDRESPDHYRPDAKLAFPYYENKMNDMYIVGDFAAGFLWTTGPASAIKDLDTYSSGHPYGRFLPKVLGWAGIGLSFVPAVAIGAASAAIGLTNMHIFRLP